jgi:hypothetical protein
VHDVGIRIVSYMLAGLSAGVMVWIPVCGTPFLSDPVAFLLMPGLLLPIFAVAFVLLLRQSFKIDRDGLTVSPGQVFATDLTVMTAAATAAFFIVDGFSERLGGPQACVTDPLAADVIAVMFVPVAAVLALFVTQTSNQRVRADEYGVHIDGISGDGMTNWADIAAFSPELQHVLVGRLGFLVPRHLRTNLVVATRSGEAHTIYDPGSASARRRILAVLRRAMPEAMRPMLKEIEQAWD